MIFSERRINLFYLDHDPRSCAVQHCDQHVRKMIIEYAQMLSTAHRVLDGAVEVRTRPITGHRYRYWSHPILDDRLYRATHYNHPLNIWVRSASEHYMYLYNLMLWLNHEFMFRHRRDIDHLSVQKLKSELQVPPKALRSHLGGFTEPPQCMPEQFKVPGDTIQAYRNFYIGDKIRFATYTNREPPDWFKQHLFRYNSRI